MTPPASGSALGGFWDTDDSLHINYIGTNNHVHELYIAPTPAGSTTTSPHSRSPEPVQNRRRGDSYAKRRHPHTDQQREGRW